MNTILFNHLDTVDKLIDKLNDAAVQKSLLLIHIYWTGCPACSPDAPLTNGIHKLREKYDFMEGDIPWRESGSVDYQYPETAGYRIFREMVQCKPQQLGGYREVESYTVPPWDRPHFPQLFFLNSRFFNTEHLQNLKNALKGFKDENGVWRKLLNNGNEPILMIVRNKGVQLGEDYWVQNKLRGILPPESILIQLLNEHLFSRPNEDLQMEALESTVKCIVSAKQPKTCFRYSRPSLHPGCKSSG